MKERKKVWKVDIVTLTRTGKEGMEEEVGDWPGRFKALNLGTTATLTLRRGIFCGKRSEWVQCLGSINIHG